MSLTQSEEDKRFFLHTLGLIILLLIMNSKFIYYYYYLFCFHLQSKNSLYTENRLCASYIFLNFGKIFHSIQTFDIWAFLCQNVHQFIFPYTTMWRNPLHGEIFWPTTVFPLSCYFQKSETKVFEILFWHIYWYS